MRIGRRHRRAEAERSPRAREVLASATNLARHHPLRVIVPAFVIIGVTTPAEIYVDRSHATGAEEPLALAIVATAMSTIGVVVYSGVLERLVGDAKHKRERGLWEVLKSVPYLRLLVADVLVTFLVIVGLVLLVAPGLVVTTLFGLVGALINLEDLPVLRAMRRSLSLVRRRFGLAFLLVTLPELLLGGAASAVGNAAHALALPADIIVMVVTESVVGAVTGLLIVELTFALSSRYPQGPAAASAGDATVTGRQGAAAGADRAVAKPEFDSKAVNRGGS